MPILDHTGNSTPRLDYTLSSVMPACVNALNAEHAVVIHCTKSSKSFLDGKTMSIDSHVSPDLVFTLRADLSETRSKSVLDHIVWNLGESAYYCQHIDGT